jgi:hypothetical protein
MPERVEPCLPTLVPKAPLDEVVRQLSLDCPWRHEPGRKPIGGRSGEKCGAYLPDLQGPPRPPDLPPAVLKLRVLAGGKKS